jgi:hypothetical protein
MLFVKLHYTLVFLFLFLEYLHQNNWNSIFSMRDWKTPLAEGVIIIIYYLKNLIKFNILILI